MMMDPDHDKKSCPVDALVKTRVDSTKLICEAYIRNLWSYSMTRLVTERLLYGGLRKLYSCSLHFLLFHNTNFTKYIISIWLRRLHSPSLMYAST